MVTGGVNLEGIEVTSNLGIMDVADVRDASGFADLSFQHICYQEMKKKKNKKTMDFS